MLSQIIPDPSRQWQKSDSIAFSIGDFDVAWYGIFIFFGFALAIFVAIMKLWKWYRVSTDVVYWYCIMLIPLAIIGARFWSYCLGDAKDWTEFFNFKTGGLAIEGGVTLSVIFALWWFPFFSKKPSNHVRDEFGPKPMVRQVSMWVYADACLPAIFLGQIIGRWGNYFNQELYGPVVSSEWLQGALNHTLPWMFVGSEWRHPLFLYEGFLNFIGWASIYIGLEFIKVRKAGDMGIAYFVWYGVVRLALEPLREHTYTFSNTYILSGLWVSLGVLLFLMNHFVFVKIRKVRVKKIIFDWIAFSFTTIGAKINLLFHRDSKQKTEYYLNKKASIRETYTNRKKKNYRTEDEMLFYRGL